MNKPPKKKEKGQQPPKWETVRFNMRMPKKLSNKLEEISVKSGITKTAIVKSALWAELKKIEENL